MAFEFKFNADQIHQKQAIDNVVDLFEGLLTATHDVYSAEDVKGNMLEFDELEEFLLEENLQAVQTRHNEFNLDAPIAVSRLNMAYGDGPMLENVSNSSFNCPHFTVEMETGTGKTYVYFRTMLELFTRYGLRKFIVVVPSIAILEGVKKAFATMKAHFASLYGNTNFSRIEFDGDRLGDLRSFASNPFPTVLFMTLQSFNRASNTIYKSTESLPGERKPFEWIQAVRPIIVLDEPQNMTSDKSMQAVRTLKPLFVLHYSATHRREHEPNLVYKLTPMEAFRGGLVKQIEVIGIADLSGVAANLLQLEEIVRLPGRGKAAISARVRAITLKDGISKIEVLTLKQGDDLYAKTKLEEHKGFVVKKIALASNDEPNRVIFENEIKITSSDEVIGSRVDVWKAQIERTLETHFKRQAQLEKHGIKVLSLFFIDRVANYTTEPGTIRKLFDESFNCLKKDYPSFAAFAANEVRAGYFAKKKAKKGSSDEIVDDATNENPTEKEAKEAFKLIMQDKERLLGFSSPVSFIFAHSALKEGWDNPNVFQICTLNQTTASIKKRQEIGRGLRLCVDQEGTRPDGMNINILTVVANESYESYVTNLQQNYVDDGDGAPPKPQTPEKSKATRRDDLFELDAFKTFWASLSHRLSYRITIDTPDLISKTIERMNDPRRTRFPQPILTVSKGRYIVTDYVLRVESAAFTHPDGRATPGNWAKIILESKDTHGKISDLGLIPMDTQVFALLEKDDLFLKTKNLHFRGFKVKRVWKHGGEARVKFDNEVEISESEVHRFQETSTKPNSEREQLIATTDHAVNDFIARAEQETNLTRATITEIFLGVNAEDRLKIFKNPEGWTNTFITTLKDALADHIADRVEFFNKHLEPLDENEYFPKEVNHAGRELIDGGAKSLYDRVQVDSTTVEVPFVEHSLRDDENNIVFYFKFPGKFKLGLPKIIGNYNPDWGIVRIMPNGAGSVQLVRETKGSDDLEKLRFQNEGRKLIAAKKYFAALGIDYRWVTGETPNYWETAT